MCSISNEIIKRNQLHRNHAICHVKFSALPKNSARVVNVTVMCSVRENKDLYKVAHLYVLRNFEEVAVNSEQLMEMPMEELFTILNDDLLNVKDECLVWQCILRWIEHDREARQAHIAKLLSAIRLGCLNATVGLDTLNFSLGMMLKILQYFMDNIISHEYVVNNAETQPIILEVLNFLNDLNDLGAQNIKVRSAQCLLPLRSRESFSDCNSSNGCASHST